MVEESEIVFSLKFLISDGKTALFEHVRHFPVVILEELNGSAIQSDPRFLPFQLLGKCGDVALVLTFPRGKKPFEIRVDVYPIQLFELFLILSAQIQGFIEKQAR